MKKNGFLLGFAALMLGVALVATDADAKRLGGGASSVGAQRSVTNAPSSQTPPRQAQQAAPQASRRRSPPPRPRRSPRALRAGRRCSAASRWAHARWLMGANGMGGMLVGMMLVALLVFAGIFVVRMLAQKRGDAPRPMQYSEWAARPWPRHRRRSRGIRKSGCGANQTSPLARAVATVPAGFDVQGFLKGAKLNYMKLQSANDQGDLDTAARIRHARALRRAEEGRGRPRWRRAAHRRAVAQRGPARSRHRRRHALGERALLGHDPRDRGRARPRASRKSGISPSPPTARRLAALPASSRCTEAYRHTKGHPAVAFCFSAPASSAFMNPFELPVAARAHHLLRAEPWARERLAPFDGDSVEFRAPPAAAACELAIGPEGLLGAPDAARAARAAPSLVVTIGPGAACGCRRAGEEHLLRRRSTSPATRGSRPR